MPGCATCAQVEPCSGCDGPYGQYSLVGQSYLNGVTGFGPNCPEGFICGPDGPTPEEPPWDPPPPPDEGEGDRTIQLQGCSSLIVRNIAAGISESAYLSILQEMTDERHAQQEACDDFPSQEPDPTGPGASFTNDVYCLECPDGSMVQNDQLPSGLYVENDSLCCQSGLFVRLTKEQANLVAAQYVNNMFATLIDSGAIACGTPWIPFGFPHNNCGDWDCLGAVINAEMPGSAGCGFTPLGGPCVGIPIKLWSGGQSQSFGPYLVDKDVTIQGTADYERGTLLCAGGGGDIMKVSATGLILYSGDYLKTFFGSTASVHEVFSVTGTLLAGNVVNVAVQGTHNIFGTNNPTMAFSGTVEIVDS